MLPFHRADVLSFGSAIAAFAQGYDWVKASWLLRSMSLYGRQPSELCTNACLSALARTRRWRRAVQVLPQAVTDAVSYDTVIAAVPWIYWAAVIEAGSREEPSLGAVATVETRLGRRSNFLGSPDSDVLEKS